MQLSQNKKQLHSFHTLLSRIKISVIKKYNRIILRQNEFQRFQKNRKFLKYSQYQLSVNFILSISKLIRLRCVLENRFWTAHFSSEFHVRFVQNVRDLKARWYHGHLFQIHTHTHRHVIPINVCVLSGGPVFVEINCFLNTLHGQLYRLYEICWRGIGSGNKWRWWCVNNGANQTISAHLVFTWIFAFPTK